MGEAEQRQEGAERGEDTRTIQEQVLESLQATLGPRLVAAYEFGSAFGRTPQGPRVRMLLLVDRIDRKLLDEVAPIGTRARSEGLALRLESADALVRGADAFPVFALELSDTAKLLCGEDRLPQLQVDASRLRLRLEQSLRTAHRDLVRAYLERGTDAKRVAIELRRSAHRLIYLFEATLIAAGKDLPAEKNPETVIAALCEHITSPEDGEIWQRLRALAAYEVSLPRDDLYALFGDVLGALDRVVDVVDRMEA